VFDQPNYDIPSFGDAGQVNGPEAVRELWQGLVAGFPDLHIEPGRHLHTDDAVFVEVVFSGTQQGEWAGIPATGRQGSVRIACLYEFEEDRLVCERVWFDFATIMRQLGVLRGLRLVTLPGVRGRSSFRVWTWMRCWRRRSRSSRRI
jgi:predicted ester cyclase